MRRITLALVLGMSDLAVASAQSGSPIQISIRTSASAYTADEAIKLQITITNVSDQPVEIYTASGKPNGGEAEDNNGIYLRDTTGRVLPRIDGRSVIRKDGTMVKVRPSPVSRRGVILAPGDNFQDFTILTRLFDLTKPGQYSVIVAQDIRIDHAEPAPTLSTSTSNTVVLTIIALPTKQ